MLLTRFNIASFASTLIQFSSKVQNSGQPRSPTHITIQYGMLSPQESISNITLGPVLDILELELHPTTVQGMLFPPKNRVSIARETPNAVADEIWEEWGLARFIPLTRADIVRLGKDLSIITRLEDREWGLGGDAYVSAFNVYHQIQCLNGLRRIVYQSYYNEMLLDHDSMGLRGVHVNHCVDILLQAIQCSGNVNPMTYHKVAGQEYLQSDM